MSYDVLFIIHQGVIMKRLVFSVLILMGTVFSACAKKESNNIVIWHSFTQGARKDFFDNMARKFEAENPGVKIEIEVFPWATFQTKWTTGLSTGSLPDISTGLPTQVADMIRADLLLPLNDVIDSIGRADFYEAPLYAFTKDEKNYGISLYSHAHVLWYRKDILAKNGITPPKTWDELAKAVSTLTKVPDYYGLSFPMAKTDYLSTLFLLLTAERSGDHILEKDGTVVLTSPNMIRNIKYWVDIYKKGSPQSSINFATKEQSDLFYKGKAVFDFNSGFHIGGIIQNSPELSNQIAAVPVPMWKTGDPDNGVIASHIPIVIWKQTKNAKIAKQFLAYILKKENYVPFLHSVPAGMLSTLKSISESEEFYNNPIIAAHRDDVKVIQQAVALGKAPGLVFGPQKGTGIIANQGVIEEMFQNIILNNVPVEKAAKDAEDRLNKLINEIK